MILKLPRGRDIQARHTRTALTIAIIVLVSGACGWDSLAPGGGSGCGTACQTYPIVTPYLSYILKGDTVRLSACNDYNRCTYGSKDTGNVVTRWSVSDSNIAVLAAGSSAALVPAATNVLLRGAGRGNTTLTATFSTSSYGWKQPLHVADSADITAIELPTYGFTDTLRIGAQQVFSVYLKDVGGNSYGARPTLYVTDTTVLKLTVEALYGTLTVRVQALKAGKANLEATFLALTARRPITVVP